MSVKQRFLAFLYMSDESLKRCIRLYNAGKLSPQSREALEAVEAMIDEDVKK